MRRLFVLLFLTVVIGIAATTLSSANHLYFENMSSPEFNRALQSLFLGPGDSADFSCCHYSIDNGTQCNVPFCIDYLAVVNGQVVGQRQCSTATPGQQSYIVPDGQATANDCGIRGFFIRDKNGVDHFLSQGTTPADCISVQISQNCTAGICMSRDVGGCPVIVIRPTPGCSC